MSRPTDWQEVFGFDDPTPGDPYEIKRVSTSWSDLSDDAEYAEGKLRQLLGDPAISGWIGEAGDAFREKSFDLPGQLEKCKNSYALASSAMATWSSDLDGHQTDADNALADGREAKKELDSANATLDSASGSNILDYLDKYGSGEPPEGVDKPTPEQISNARHNLSSAQGAVSSAQGKLDAARKLASDAGSLREDDGKKCADKIREASDAGIEERSWWEKVKDAVAEAWDVLVEICKIVVLVLGIVALILGGPLAWVVLAAALVVLADTLIKYAKGEASLLDVALAALDCIPGAKGLTSVAKLAKMAKAGKSAIAAKGTVAAVSAAIKAGGGKAISMGVGAFKGLARISSTAGKATLKASIEGLAKITCGDPVDVATGDVLYPDEDLVLPGVLPLALTRSHSSSCRWGQWFGRSWASSFDERLVVTDDDFIHVKPDASLAAFPRPGVDGATVTAKHGLPARLREVDDGWEILDPRSGLRRRFVGAALTVAGERSIPLVEIVQDGDSITFLRDEAGRPVEVRHSGGYRVIVETGDERITALSFLGERDTPMLVRRYEYSAHGDLAAVIDESGSPFRFSYDDAGRLLRWVDRNGFSYDYLYDEQGRCVDQGGDQGVLSFRYSYLPDPEDPEGSVTVAAPLGGAATAYHIDGSFRVVRTEGPGDTSTTQTWTETGQVATRTDALGRRVRFDYSAAGNLVRAERPDGSVESCDYETLDGGAERLIAVTQPDGGRWTMHYGADGRRSRVEDPTGSVTGFAYNDRGHVVATIDPLGSRTDFVLDGAGLVLAVSHPSGRRLSVGRDAFGRVVEADSPESSVRAGWSPGGRPLWRRDEAGVEQWRYDAQGNVVERVDQSGSVSTFTYGAFDLRLSAAEPDGATTWFTYDSALRLVGVQNPARSDWTYRYDDRGNLVEERDYNGATTTYDYDAANQLVRRTNGAGQSLDFGYDLLGRVASKRTVEETTSFEYDAFGRLTDAANGASVLHIERDALGAVLAETCNGRAVRFETDAAGRRVGRTTPGGTSTRWFLDADGLPTGLHLAGHEIQIGRDEAGRQSSMTWGETVLSQEFGAGGAIAGQRVTTGDVSRLDRRYDLRPDGRPLAVIDSLGRSVEFDLDARGRVVAEDRTALRGRARHTYDAAGNLDIEDRGRRFEGTLLTEDPDCHYAHDGHGRLITKVRRRISRKPEVWQYRWDAEDRLVGLRTPDGTEWRYRYDGMGRRVAKERLAADGTTADTVHFAWDGALVVEETREDGATVWDYLDGRPVVQVQTSLDRVDAEFYAIVTDIVGAPSELFDATGDLVWASERSTWGARTDTTGTPLGLPGQYLDEESGLCYNVFRYYDADAGRYISPDPLGVRGGSNPSAYVENPLASSDPLGLACIKEIASRIQSITTDVAKRFDAGDNLIKLTRGQQAALDRLGDAGEWLTPVFRGERIDFYVKQSVKADDFFKDLIKTGELRLPTTGALRPDFVHTLDGITKWLDITTINAWDAHVAKYLEEFGEGFGIFT